MTSDDLLLLLSQILGWVYFVAWSISFYPQLLLNYQRKSVQGLSFEFLAFNATGFLFYSIFTVATYIEQLRLKLDVSVEPSDIAFAIHAFVVTALTIVQCVVYERGNQRFQFEYAILLGAIWFFVCCIIILCSARILPWINTSGQYELTLMQVLGYSKAFISVVKLIPQAVFNYKRKSTIGWSIGNILLDLTGGTFSFLQQLIDAMRQDTWDVFFDDIPKLILALQSIAFDLLFIVQHYVLYPPRRVEASLVEPLTSSTTNDERVVERVEIR